MIFIQDQYQYLASHFIEQEHYIFSQFVNQEYTIQLHNIVKGRSCMVIGSLTAPAEQAVQLLLLLHTLRVNGASSVRLFSPYLGYQRQDNQKDRMSHGLDYADAMMLAAGVEKVITIEPHSLAALSRLNVPVYSYRSDLIFKEEMQSLVNRGFSFVFPDGGSLDRYHWILEQFPTTLYGYFLKKRLQSGMIELESFSGKIGNKVIVYDDILDSGQTLLQVCIALKAMGVDEIVIFVTHAFFYGNAWHQLFNLGVEKLYCSNSLPLTQKIDHFKVHVKSITFFLQKSM